MIKHENPLVENVGHRIADMLGEVETLFRPGVKLTLVARRPDKPDGSQDMVISNDTTAGAIEALQMRLKAESAPDTQTGGDNE